MYDDDDMEPSDRRDRGSSKRRFRHVIKGDMEVVKTGKEDVSDRNKWKTCICYRKEEKISADDSVLWDQISVDNFR